MRDLIIEIFGEYTPVLDPVTGNVAAGLAGVDWPYVAGIGVFCIVLWSFFAIVGAVIKR